MPAVEGVCNSAPPRRGHPPSMRTARRGCSCLRGGKGPRHDTLATVTARGFCGSSCFVELALTLRFRCTSRSPPCVGPQMATWTGQLSSAGPGDAASEP
eukprot:3268950-Pyramimonas_sp.AAC.1